MRKSSLTRLCACLTAAMLIQLFAGLTAFAQEDAILISGPDYTSASQTGIIADHEQETPPYTGVVAGWVEYTLPRISAQDAGSYELSLHSSLQGNMGVIVSVDGGEPFTKQLTLQQGAWQQQDDILGTVQLSAGVHTLKLEQPAPGLTVCVYSLTLTKTGDVPEPPIDNAVTFEGKTYTAISETGVNVEHVDETPSYIGLVNGWAEYRLPALTEEEAGRYELKIHDSLQGPLSVEVSVDGQPALTKELSPQQGAWQQQDDILGTVSLSDGVHTLRIGQPTDGVTLCLYTITLTRTSGGEDPDPTETPGGTTPTASPTAVPTATPGPAGATITVSALKFKYFSGTVNPDHIALNGPDGSVLYEVEAEEAGDYMLTMETASGMGTNTGIEVYVNDFYAAEGSCRADGWGEHREDEMGLVTLRAGKNTIRFDAIAPNTSCAFFQFKLVKASSGGEEEADPSLEFEKLEAEAYTGAADGDGVVKVPGGTGTAVQLAAGQSLTYPLNLSAGDWQLKANLSLSGEAALKVELDDVCLGERTYAAPTGVYHPVMLANIQLGGGSHVLKVTATAPVTVDYYAAGKADGYLLRDAVTVRTECETKSGGGKVVSDGSGEVVTLGNGERMSLRVSAPAAGKYQVSVRHGSPAAAEQLRLSLSAGGNAQSMSCDASGGWSRYRTSELGTVVFNAGEQTVEITNQTSTGANLDYFIFKYIGADLETASVKANEAPLAGNQKAARGTDTFTLTMTDAVSAQSVSPDTVSLVDTAGNRIAAEYRAEQNQITMLLRQSLEFDTVYRLRIEGLTDWNGTRMSGRELLSFATCQKGAADAGVSAASVSGAGADYERFHISGTVVSGSGLGIAGRDVSLTGGHSSGAPLTVPSVRSGADGGFEFKFTLPSGSKNGMYEFEIMTDYLPEPLPVQIYYIDQITEGGILTAFQSPADAAAVKTQFMKYASDLAIDPAADMKMVPDQDAVYQYFAGKTAVSVPAIRQDYVTFIALETFNQAGTASLVKSLLADAETCASLNLEKGKADLIKGQKTALAQAILDLPAIKDAAAFAEQCNALIDSYLHLEYEKQDLDAAAASISTYVGKAFSIPIGWEQPADGVSAVTYTLESSSAELFDSAELDVREGWKHTVEKTGAVWTVKLQPEKPADRVSGLGQLRFLPEKAAQYQVRINGTVEYAADIPYPLTSDIKEKNITISITQNSNKGNQNSSGSGVRPSGGGGGGTAPPKPTEKPAETDAYRFDDLAETAWAEPAVYQLAGRGVLSKPDDRLFRPEDPVTREEFVKMAVMALGAFDKGARTDLTDVQEEQWYYPYVASAVQNGLVTGKEDGSFGVGGLITREDMAVILYRAMVRLGVSGPAEPEAEPFSDAAEISDYAAEAVQAMKELQVIHGVGGGLFAPKAHATRAEAAKIIYEMMKAVGL